MNTHPKGFRAYNKGERDWLDYPFITAHTSIYRDYEVFSEPVLHVLHSYKSLGVFVPPNKYAMSLEKYPNDPYYVTEPSIRITYMDNTYAYVFFKDEEALKDNFTYLIEVIKENE